MKPIVVFFLAVVASLVLVIAVWFVLLEPKLATRGQLASEMAKLSAVDSAQIASAFHANQEALAAFKSLVQDTLLKGLSNRIALQASELNGLRMNYNVLTSRVDSLNLGQQLLAKSLQDSIGVFRDYLSSTFSLSQNRLDDRMNQFIQINAGLSAKLARTETFLEKQVIPRLNTPLRFLGLDVFKSSAKLPPLPKAELQEGQNQKEQPLTKPQP